MESPPDPASDPGNSATEPATPVRDTPVNLETLRKADHQAPVRRQSCSSTNRGKTPRICETERLRSRSAVRHH
ncbi:nuclear receptor ROR-alpha isoform X1 [Arapaima gigas]